MLRVIWNLFELIPTAEAAIAADTEAIGRIIHSLGLQNKRAATIQRFSKVSQIRFTWKSFMRLASLLSFLDWSVRKGDQRVRADCMMKIKGGAARYVGFLRDKKARVKLRAPKVEESIQGPSHVLNERKRSALPISTAAFFRSRHL